MVFLLFCSTVVAPILAWTHCNRHNTQFTSVIQTSRRYNFTGDSLYILHLYYTFNSVPVIQNSLTSGKQQCCFCCFSASIFLFLSYIYFLFTSICFSVYSDTFRLVFFRPSNLFLLLCHALVLLRLYCKCIREPSHWEICTNFCHSLFLLDSLFEFILHLK